MVSFRKEQLAFALVLVETAIKWEVMYLPRKLCMLLQTISHLQSGWHSSRSLCRMQERVNLISKLY